MAPKKKISRIARGGLHGFSGGVHIASVVLSVVVVEMEVVVMEKKRRKTKG